MISLSMQHKFFLLGCFAINQAGWITLVMQYRAGLAEANRRITHSSEEYKKLHGMGTYLLHLCEKNNIELTEFDEIALTDLGIITKDENASE